MPDAQAEHTASSSSVTRRELGLAFLCLALAVVLLFWRYLATGDMPVPRWGNAGSAVRTRIEAIKWLSRGEFPLWTPFALAGKPYFANHMVSLISPFNLPYLFLDFMDAYAVRILLEFFIGGLGTYLFLRVLLETSQLASLFGSFVFMFSGYFFWRYGILMFLDAACLIPLTLFQYGMALKRRSSWYAVSAGIFAALAIFGSYWITPYLVLATGVFHATWVAVFPARPFIREAVRTLRCFAIFMAVMLGLSALQLLPSIELMVNSARLLHHKSGGANVGLLFWLSAFLFSDGWTCMTRTVPYPFGYGYEGLKGYVGVLPFLFGLVGIFWSRKKTRLPILVTGIFFLLLSFAYVCPALRRFLVSHFSAFDSMDHSFSLVFYSFAMAIMASLGLEVLAEKRPGFLRTPLLICSVLFLFIFALATCGVLLTWLMPSRIPSFLSHLYLSHLKSTGGLVHAESYYVEKIHYIFSAFMRVSAPMLLSFAAKTFAFFLFVQWLLHMQERRLPVGMLTFLVLAGMVGTGWQYVRYSSKADFQQRARTAEFLMGQDTATYRVGRRIIAIREIVGNKDIPLQHFSELAKWQRAEMAAFFGSSGTAEGIRCIAGAASLPVRRYYEYWGLLEGRQVPTRLILVVNKSPLLDLLNMRFLVSGIELKDPHLRLVCHAQGVYVYENPSALPRAFCVADAKWCADSAAVLNELAEPDFVPTKAVLLEGSEQLAEQHKDKLEWIAQLTRSTLNRVDVDVECSRPCYLVLCDVYYPGWIATVNGARVPIIPAYHALRAVRLGEGKSHVTFKYRPASFFLGSSITGATVLLLIILAVKSWTRKRQRA